MNAPYIPPLPFVMPKGWELNPKIQELRIAQKFEKNQEVMGFVRDQKYQTTEKKK